VRVRTGERRGRPGREIARIDRRPDTRRRKPKRGAWRPDFHRFRPDTALDTRARPWIRMSSQRRGRTERCGRSREGTERNEGNGRRNAVRLVSRDKPLKGNPERGSGMKQARKASDGANHRGRAKRRGWTVRSELGALANQWTSLADVAKRALPKPQGRRSRRERSGPQGPRTVPGISGRSVEQQLRRRRQRSREHEPDVKASGDGDRKRPK
jgi:hypothetical protein